MNSREKDVLNDMADEMKLKRLKTEEHSLKEMLRNLYQEMMTRMNGLDKKIEDVIAHCKVLDDKINLASGNFSQSDENSIKTSPNAYLASANVFMNIESDFPSGSWLGYENDPQRRVRCQITSEDMTLIDRSCHSAEKMALTLLDFLFDRETQACSNISGQGRHGKKQLDPLIIYGIKCHLMYRFNITENDWHKIRLNMDSKCRTAFRRKLKGMPLTVKAFRGSELIANEKAKSVKVGEAACDSVPSTSTSTTEPVYVVEGCVQSEDEHMFAAQPALEETFLTLDDHNAFPLELGLEIDSNSQVIQGEIQVLHATPEQLAEIQKSGKIKIITSNHLLNADIKLDSAKWDSSLADNFIVFDGLPNETIN